MPEETPEFDLPRGVALAWGVAADPQRGPKRELSIERIVDAAVTIADAEGLGAVSMSSVATALGFTTMSLYRYVSAKDDLILLMQEAGIGLPPANIAAALDWRTALTLWSRESLANYLAHPWLVDVPIVGTPNTPNNLAWLDVALQALENTPLDQQERISTALLLSGQTRWEASIVRGYVQDAAGAAERERTDAQIVATLVTAEAFPHLHAAIAAGVFDADDDNPFEFGLSRVLDGIEHYMTGRPPGRAPATRTSGAPESHPRDEKVKLARQVRREAEKKLREALKNEREAVKNAVEREKHLAEKAAAKAAKPG